MINRQALFTDETVNFKVPYEPNPGEKVSLQIRTLRNDVSAVYVIMGARKHAMKKASQDISDTFDFYQYTFTCPQKKVSYYFEICDEDEQLYYNRLGVVTNNQEEYNFAFTPGQKVPDWALGKVFYQIYPDRFCNGDPSNDVCDNEYYYTGGHTKKITNWDKIPDHLDVSNFYGGDLQGIRSKLDYLQDLGVEAIYLNPIFVSPSNHKYDTQDYDYVDPHLAVIEDDNEFTMQNWERHNGFAARYIKRVTSKTNLKKSNAYFADFVKELHSRGIKIVIDGVFNHCGSFNKWMDREGIYLNKEGYEVGAYHSTQSPYRSYFKFDKPVAHSDYEGWWGYQTLPKLNYEKSEELKNYVLATGAKWVSAPYNVDGWRLDVAADLGHSEKYNHKFWQEFHASVKNANPEAFIFAEHYGDPSNWLESGKEWDSVMNYDAFMEPVTWFLTGVDKHSKSYNEKWRGNGKAFFEAMFKAMARFPRPALDSAINQLSNHDHSRFLTRTNGRVRTIQEKGGSAASDGIDKRIMKLGILIQMTWVGSPTLYYADEVGQVGWTDPDSRRTFPWGHEDWDLYNTYKSAIALRNKVHCIRMGSLVELDAGDGYIAYGRFDIVDGLITVINSSDKEIALAVPVWQVGTTWQDKLKLAFAVGYQGTSAESSVDINYGRAYIKIPPKSGVCYYKRFSGQPMKNLRLYSGDVRFTTKYYQFKQFKNII